MLSLLVIILIAGLGVFGIVSAIDLCEFLRKYKPKQWETVTYKHVFGIPRDKFPINPIRPLKFIIFIFSSKEGHGLSIPVVQIRLRLVIISLILLCVAFIFFT